MNQSEFITSLQKSIAEQQPSNSEPSLTGSIYVVLRRKSEKVNHSWHQSQPLETLLKLIFDEIGDPKIAQKIDTAEICFTQNYQKIELEDLNNAFSNAYRGVRGIEILAGQMARKISPTEMIATNRDFYKLFEQFLEEHNISFEAFFLGGGEVQSFDASQFLIDIPSRKVTPLFRGGIIVELTDISPSTLQGMAAGMANWLLRHVYDDGHLTYKYWPSSGNESDANNMIRQFMATLALTRYAKVMNLPEFFDVINRNLTYNLNNFYRQEGDVGWIEYEDKAKLGAASLAALTLLEQPNNPFPEILDCLQRGILELWQPDGSFRTFRKPSERNDCQNFYPGETLLFWASLYQKNKDENVLERCVKSFLYYRDWHRANKNPAFIPWHTQAYFVLQNEPGCDEMRNFIFEMNDWLLSMQQWKKTKFPDTRGRFYNPNRSDYGPPHASSTGVYLEGLADAYQLSQQLKDSGRGTKYCTVIHRGLRSIRQLQFFDEAEMFYISKQDHVLGGLRTTVYDNTIRVDNVQHCLMAIIKLLQMPSFLGYLEEFKVANR